MDEYTFKIIISFIFFGWIPILAIGKAIAWCIEATHPYETGNTEEEVKAGGGQVE